MLICGVCKMQFTSLHSLAQHKKIPCRLRMSCQCQTNPPKQQGNHDMGTVCWWQTQPSYMNWLPADCIARHCMQSLMESQWVVRAADRKAMCGTDVSSLPCFSKRFSPRVKFQCTLSSIVRIAPMCSCMHQHLCTC